MKSLKQFKINQLIACQESNTVSSHEKRLPLEPKALALLKFLAVNNDRTHSVDVIQQEVWRGVAVCKHAIYRTIGRIRQVLRQLDPSCHYIETVASQGYRLVGEVSLDEDSFIFERMSLTRHSEITQRVGIQAPFNLGSVRI